jgi:phage-related protein
MKQIDSNEIRLTVKFYRTVSGNEPVREWLLACSQSDKRTVGTDIRTIQYRWPLGMPLVRKMGKDLWEVRSHLENGISRVLFTVDGNQIVLLHGFVKKSVKTPRSDLQIAKARLAELQESKEGK